MENNQTQTQRPNPGDEQALVPKPEVGQLQAMPQQPQQIIFVPMQSPWQGMMPSPYGTYPALAPPRGNAFKASAGLVVMLGVGAFGVIGYAMKPAAPKAVEVVERVVEKTVAAPAPAPPPPPPVVAPAPPPAPVMVAAAAPPPPKVKPWRWDGVWRSRGGNKSVIHLKAGERGVTGFYAMPNGSFPLGDIERVKRTDAQISFSVVIGSRRHGLRLEREGEAAKVYRWVDVDGVKAEAKKIEDLFAQRKLQPYQVLPLRRELATAVKEAGKETYLGVFERADEEPTLAVVKTPLADGYSGVWAQRGGDAALLRLRSTDAGLEGDFAPGAVESATLVPVKGEVSGGTASFAANIGGKLWRFKLSREGDAARLMKWLDPSSLMDGYSKAGAQNRSAGFVVIAKRSEKEKREEQERMQKQREEVKRLSTPQYAGVFDRLAENWEWNESATTSLTASP